MGEDFTMIMMMMNVILLLNIPVVITQYTKVSPCRVQNVILRPQFAISVKTKKLVDILQVPPNFTQTIHADICVDSDTTFSRHPRSNIPNFGCRQRFSGVELYLKTREDFLEIPSVPIKSMSTGKQLDTDFVKDFVLIEAGCDTFFNFLPSRSAKKHTDNSLKNVEGVVALNGESESGDIVSQQLFQIFEAEADKSLASRAVYKTSNLKPRSMIKSDFFRKGMYLYPNATKKNTTEIDQEHELNSSDNDDDNTRGNEDDRLPEGEVRLSPDSIGLPLLFLDPSLDPVLRIISQDPVK